AAQAVSRTTGGMVSFTLNKLWTFENRDVRTMHLQMLRFITIWAVAYVSSTLLIEVYRGILGDVRRVDFIAKLFAEGTLGLLSFFAQRYWAFRKVPKPNEMSTGESVRSGGSARSSPRPQGEHRD
ncbi:MAG: GtrA family protein, partial [Kiritimatiellia bacterium]|nr:GtrA family protein [Kiritimatiellia bacterium]